ncbi:hypothetical protein [Francisella marina]|uniref:hypothetical protein n=1 Tax=Francisella marina TaxID=2249302 RepID=UPI0011F00BD6|nr:hypothetical protein [Francisella marina]QEO58295.1 hypothetical protein F0R75_00360 [Francisella marina]
MTEIQKRDEAYKELFYQQCKKEFFINRVINNELNDLDLDYILYIKDKLKNVRDIFMEPSQGLAMIKLTKEAFNLLNNIRNKGKISKKEISELEDYMLEMKHNLNDAYDKIFELHEKLNELSKQSQIADYKKCTNCGKEMRFTDFVINNKIPEFARGVYKDYKYRCDDCNVEIIVPCPDLGKK